MRLIDADAFKQYCSEGLEEMKSLFKTDKGAELAVPDGSPMIYETESEDTK